MSDAAPMANVVLRSRARASFILGLALLLAVVCLWTVSSFLTNVRQISLRRSAVADPAQNILTGREPYNKPFLITWLCTASFTFYLIPPAFTYLRDRRRGIGYDAVDKVDAIASPVGSDAPLTTRETAHLAALFCTVWFAANYSMNASLALTTVSSMTVLSATSGALPSRHATL